MADIDLKTSTPDTSLPTTGFLFGADSQAALAPSVFTTQAVATTLLGSTTLSGATITADAPVLNMSQTWNNAAVTFTGIKFNATDTASNAASLLMDLQVGGSSRFGVLKDGNVYLQGGTSVHFIANSNGGGLACNNAGLNDGTYDAVYSGYGPRFSNSVTIGWAAASTVNAGGGSPDTILTRRGAANLRLGAADTTGTTAPTPQFLSAQSWASSTNNNQTGANFTIDGSQGTGTGAGGSIVFRVAPAGAISNGTQNGLAITAQLGPFQGKLYLGSATPTSANYALWGDGTNTWVNAPTAGGYVHFGSNDNWGMAVQPASVRLSSTFTFGWTASNPGAALDLILTRDAANTLALRNGANAQTFRVYNTTDGTNSEFGKIAWSSNVLQIGTEKAGTGTARPLQFQTNGVTALTINTDRSLTLTGVGTAAISNVAVVGNDNSLVLTGSAYVAAETPNFAILSSGTRAFWIERSTAQHMVSGFTLGWSNSATNAAAGDDTILFREAAGITGVRGANTTTGGALGFIEQTAPAAPATNGVRIYAEDNGSGKTRLMALFATGAAVQIAIEP